MARWQRLERWLSAHEGERFTVHKLAKSMRIEVRQASRLIQSYLAAQRGGHAATLYVLKREGRTRSAVWSVGQRAGDVRQVGHTLFSDVVAKTKRGFAPDLQRIAEINPRAASLVESKIEAVMTGALTVLAASVDSFYGDE